MNEDFWNDKYSSTLTYGDRPNAFLESQAQVLSEFATAFVPGDGEGRNGIWLAKLGLDVTTLDLSQVAVDRARAAAIEENVSLDVRQGDLRSFEFPDEKWDVVAAIWLHMRPEVREEVHRNLWKSLCVGGVFLIEAYRPEQIDFREEHGTVGGPKAPELLFTRETLLSDFPDGEFELLEETEVEIEEGTGHQGLSAVIRARIRKR